MTTIKNKTLITKMDIPPTSSQALLKWCALYNMRNDFLNDPSSSVELINMLTMKMKGIEDCNPDWETRILPLLKPYFRDKKL